MPLSESEPVRATAHIVPDGEVYRLDVQVHSESPHAFEPEWRDEHGDIYRLFSATLPRFVIDGLQSELTDFVLDEEFSDEQG